MTRSPHVSRYLQFAGNQYLVSPKHPRCRGKELIPASSSVARGGLGRIRGDKSPRSGKHAKSLIPSSVPPARCTRGYKRLPVFPRVPGLLPTTLAQAGAGPRRGGGDHKGSRSEINTKPKRSQIETKIAPVRNQIAPKRSR